MTNTFFKYYKPKILLTLIIILTSLFIFAKEYWEISVSITGIIGGFLWVIDKWLWKYKPFSWLFWIEDFSGRYEGFLEYEFRDENCQKKTGRLNHTKLIYQIASVIKISAFTFQQDGKASSPSESIEVAVKKDDNGVFTLIYTYENKGNPQLGFPPHYGTEVVKIIGKGEGKQLSGDYYTNRVPIQTRGRFVDLKYINDDLSHPF